MTQEDKTRVIQCEICGSHRDCKNYCHLGCDTLEPGKHLVMFWNNLKPPSTEWGEASVNFYQIAWCHTSETTFEGKYKIENHSSCGLVVYVGFKL